MVRACGKNGWVPVRLDGYREGGLGQQNHDGGSCATMLERYERMEPWCICNWFSFTRQFLLGSVFFRTALPCSSGYHLERVGMPLHGAETERAQLLKIKPQVSRIWAKGCMLDDGVCVIWLDTTIPPWRMEKVMVYFISNFICVWQMFLKFEIWKMLYTHACKYKFPFIYDCIICRYLQHI